MRFNFEAENMSIFCLLHSFILIITYPVFRQSFGAPLSHKAMYNLKISLLFKHKLVHDIYNHYTFTELRPMYSTPLPAVKYFIFKI